MKIKESSTVYAYAITLCMGSFVFGYELTSFGNLSSVLSHENHLNQGEASRTMTYFNIIFGVFNLFGIFFYQYIKQYGWIQLFKITDGLTILAAIIGMVNLQIASQYWSRSIFGFVTGINTILIPTFLTSILPGSMGAPAGTLNQFFIVFGIFCGFWIGFLVIDEPNSAFYWRLLIGLPILPALIRNHCLETYFRYQALQILMATHQDQILQHYLNRIYINVQIPEFQQSKRLTEEDIREESAPFCSQESKFYRMRFSIAMGIVALNQFSGGAALAFFGGIESFRMFSNTPSSILSIFVYLNLLQLVFTLIAGQYIEKYGRRTFMLLGQTIIILSLFLIAFIQIVTPQFHALTLIITFIQMLGFSLSYGPCTFLIGTEVVNDIFYPALLQWVLITFNFIVTQSLVLSLGIGVVCLIFGLVQIGGFLFFESYQIETQGKLRRNVYKQFRSGTYPSHKRPQIRQIQEKKYIELKDLQRHLIQSKN